MGTDVCFMATSAPPQSRNHTLYSSSKICKRIRYCVSAPHHWEWKTQKKNSKRLHAFLHSAKHTCLQEFPPSEEMNTPTSVSESSEPILPATQTSVRHSCIDEHRIPFSRKPEVLGLTSAFLLFLILFSSKNTTVVRWQDSFTRAMPFEN